MKSGAGNMEQRLVVLEEKLEYQDYTLEKLNEVIITQQQQLDKYELELQRLREKVEIHGLELEQEGKSVPPPHF